MCVCKGDSFVIYIVIKMPQKLTTTACFIQGESSGGKQFRKHVSCFRNCLPPEDSPWMKQAVVVSF